MGDAELVGQRRQGPVEHIGQQPPPPGCRRVGQIWSVRLPDPAAERRACSARSCDEGRRSVDEVANYLLSLGGAEPIKALLAAFRIPILKSLPARDPVEAVTLAQEIGFPVAMKIRSPDITHKEFEMDS